VDNSYEHLAKFPTNNEINFKLSVAQSQACKIAEFAGIDSSFYSAPALLLSVAPNDDKEANEGE
jgi:hypothetical protein